MTVRTWLERRREDQRTETEGAARCDTNLNRLKQTDPDAARTFTTTFTAALRDRRAQDQLTAQVQQYAALKHQQNRLDLYNQLFA